MSHAPSSQMNRLIFQVDFYATYKPLFQILIQLENKQKYSQNYEHNTKCMCELIRKAGEHESQAHPGENNLKSCT